MTNYFKYVDKVDISNNPFFKEDSKDGNKGGTKPPAETTNTSPDFSLEETPEFYVFRNVLVNGVNYNISWTRTLLDGDAQKTQDEWMKYCPAQTEYPGKIITIPSSLVIYSCISSLRANKTKPNLSNLVEKVRQYFQESFTQSTRMTTSTRIRYKVRPTSTLDEVVHDYKSNQPIIRPVNLQGRDGLISTLGCENEMEAIFGSRNLSEINEDYKWITGSDTYLWRLNNVTAYDERPLGVGVGGIGYFDVDAVNHVDDQRCARGVVVECAQSSTGSGGAQ